MKRKLPIEQSKADILKSLRTVIRLKHSLGADGEINDVLPRVEAAFDKAVESGKAFEFDLGEWLEV